ncbi:MAG: dihydrolipoyllysine-residue acetyltransferase [Opitutae bacterium]|nr:dihydrolipoyllysine-residue acetyltransferase [Opitutae bacterium]
MAIEIILPDIGADEAEVTEILVTVGDSIEEETPLFTIEGDKAAMEIPSPQAGVVTEIKLKVGDVVTTGALAILLEGEAPPAEQEDELSEEPAAVPETEAADPVDKEVCLPDVGADEVEVTEVMVAVGDSVEAEASLIAVEGDKAAMEIPSPFAGLVKEIKVAVGDSLSSASPLMILEVTEVPEEPAEAEPEASAPVSPAPAPVAPSVPVEGFVDNREYAYASPVVRRLARQFGVDLAKVQGTGRKNRILKEDVRNYVKDALRRLESGGGGLDLLPWPEVDFAKFGEVEEQSLTKIQKLTGANLHRNWVKIPHVTQWDEADVTDLEALRKKRNAEEAQKDSGIKYTILVFVMQAVAKALRELPQMNSSLSPDEKGLVLKKYVDLGIAVDTPNGLVVPVVRGVDDKSAEELTADLFSLSAKAREGKLTMDDMAGSTFTISSLGGLGGTAFTPIVNAPNVGILGLSRSQVKPVWNGEEFGPRLLLPLSLSYDHRVIDGADGVRFLNFFKEALEEVATEAAKAIS